MKCPEHPGLCEQGTTPFPKQQLIGVKKGKDWADACQREYNMGCLKLAMKPIVLSSFEHDKRVLCGFRH